MRQFLSTALTAIFLAGVTSLPARASDKSKSEAKQVHEVRGVVRRIAPDHRTAVIRHEKIPGYMPAMTMELTIRNPDEIREIRPGDAISFRMLADEETHWIDSIRLLDSAGRSRAAETPAPAPSPGELKPGDLMPDFELITEHGERIRLSKFRGQVLAFTFIFTRCPLPDFCPLMGRNFAEARALLSASADEPANWRFLSISFDADYDTPERLSRYAATCRGSSSNRWLFAAAPDSAIRRVAPGLDLSVNRAGGSISHNLRTVVLDPQGRIHRQFDGNQWKAGELVLAMRQAGASRQPPAAPAPNGATP